jgi:L-2-hydroxyglutarate oxidase LhgO
MSPNGGNPKDERVTGDMIHNYLQQYAEDHDLLRRIRFNTFVTNASRADDGWRLTFKDSTDVIIAGKLLVCTGVDLHSLHSRIHWRRDRDSSYHSLAGSGHLVPHAAEPVRRARRCGWRGQIRL